MILATSPSDLMSLQESVAISGLDYMRGILEGSIFGAPIAGLLSYDLTEVDPGRVVFQGTPGFSHANPAGGVHGGWYGTLLDSCMACAVMTRLPIGSTYTTLEYKINITRAIPLGTQIKAIGTADHVGRSTGVAHGEIRGVEDDKLYATGSTTCLVMRIPR